MHETWHTRLFAIYYCVLAVRIENDIHMLEITCQMVILWHTTLFRANLRFYGFLWFFGTFMHNVDQTWLILHEIFYTTLFGIYYSVKVVRIGNHSHMLESTCKDYILIVFKLFWHFCA